MNGTDESFKKGKGFPFNLSFYEFNGHEHPAYTKYCCMFIYIYKKCMFIEMHTQAVFLKTSLINITKEKPKW